MLQHLIDTLTLFSAAASGSLLNAIAQGLVLTAAVAICLRLLPGIKPAARFVVWFSVLFAVLCLPLIPELKNNLGSPLSSNTASFYLDLRWSVLILGLWGALSLLRAIKLVKSVFELRRIASSATPLPASSQDPQLLKAGLRSAEVCTSSVVDRPSVVGFLHPRILLPEDLISKLSDQQLEQILLHEMEHLRRRDDWTNLFQKIALILFPLNPVLFWVERRLCVERELACDDCVLNFTSARKTYATCLANLAEHSLVRRGVSLALGAWEKQSELSRRVHRILSKPQSTMKDRTANLITGTLMTGLLGGALFFAHSPELISFGRPSSNALSAEIPATTVPADSVSRRHLTAVPVKAVLPQSQKTSTRARQSVRPPTSVKAIHRIPKPRQQQWIVLTHWQSVSEQPRPVLAVSESTTTSSYAAVSVGNGWLIFQL